MNDSKKCQSYVPLTAGCTDPLCRPSCVHRGDGLDRWMNGSAPRHGINLTLSSSYLPHGGLILQPIGYFPPPGEHSHGR